MLAESDQSTSNHPILTTNLGPLETQAMEILWTGGECKVRDVMKALNRHLAYTTVMTTLDRLFRKEACFQAEVCPCLRVLAAHHLPGMERCGHTRLARQTDGWTASSREVLIECLMEAVGQQAQPLQTISRKLRTRNVRTLHPDFGPVH